MSTQHDDQDPTMAILNAGAARSDEALALAEFWGRIELGELKPIGYVS